MPDRFDLVVIGSGPAGEKGAAQAAYFGKKVAIVESASHPGGAVVSDAEIPSKTLRETALYVTGFKLRDVYGLSLHLDSTVALQALMGRTAEVIATAAGAVQANIDRHGIGLIRGHGVLLTDRQVRVRGADGSDRVLAAEAILLAPGSSPVHPAGIPFEDPDVHDTVTILRLDRIPRSLVVVGGGAVGCEYASIFTALGVSVTLLNPGKQLLPFADAEAAEVLAAAFREVGMEVHLGVRAKDIVRAGGSLAVKLEDGTLLRPDKLLFAAGRRGNTDALGLEVAGVALDESGRIVVNERFETTAPGIYAAGDVIGPPALASASMEQGRVAVCNAFGFPFKEAVDILVPLGVYSIPELAMVGMTEEQARAKNIDVETGRASFAQNTRATISGSSDGFIKLVFRRDDRQLLGVHIVGEIAGELIHLGQAVLHAGDTIDRFINTTFAVPTRTDLYKYAAYDGLQRLAGHKLEGLMRSSSVPASST
jgi:NAD(P) transhydrogenase